MNGDWGRLGTAVQAARKAKGLTQPQLGELIGVSRATVQAIEQGREFAKITHTLRALETPLGWKAGSIENVLAGGDPTYKASDTEPDNAAMPITDDSQALPLRVRQALGEGHLLDATIIDLPAEGSDEPDAQIVIVVKSKPTASPERMRRNVAAWERVERKLRALGTADDDPSGPDAE
ncbi:transcriptional regulator with XRE-family HTH domain [Streptomyces olivoverticillatus]|uniref:Transcriptional regulator with XRE-family HTH domain n=1 Tax=Streptomyces olivoverticillatus TaxID=66427 RepID=A0A7W7PJT1_9ACTN|nr:helix-turn-helix domain-containing protein [Streptomyces olivoverticillatus]MBB4893481.1 transcriptional regulator with XRE-family HTH domain [Streptomyces olivoverticillatus]